MVKKSTKADFITKAKKIHGEKYNYDEFEYVNAITKSKIICPEHGEFFQSANTHLSGHGCPNCRRSKFKKISKLTFDIFEQLAKEKHNGKYKYISCELDSNNTKVKIICPVHGEFSQRASLHLLGQGCPKCANDNRRGKMSNGRQKFIEDARKIHGDKYDYSKVEYINSRTKVCIICPEHGEFWQTPFDHIIGNKGCPKCVGRNLSIEDFEKLARKVHGNDYTYVSFEASDKKMTIRCNKCGREFLQKGWSHLQGHGCPFCKQSKLENEVLNMLDENSIVYIPQYRIEWLNKQSIDFYLPEYDIAIECQGDQHFKPFNYFGGNEAYEAILSRDKLKKRLCDENNVNLIYYTKSKYAPNEYIGKVFNNKEKLLEYLFNKKT